MELIWVSKKKKTTFFLNFFMFVIDPATIKPFVAWFPNLRQAVLEASLKTVIIPAIMFGDAHGTANAHFTFP